MKVLYIAEPVGKPGTFSLKSTLPALRAQYQPDFVLGCADGATGGFGLGKNHAFYLHKLGLQALTLGECGFFKKDLHPLLPTANFILRPANYPPDVAGRGWKVYETKAGKVAVISLLGQSGFAKTHLANPLVTFDAVWEKVRRETPQVVVDFHAVTSAEKNTFFHYVDGRASAVIGSHQKIPTADGRLLTGGTAVISDAGRTGARQSVGGFAPHNEIERYLTGIPSRSQESWDDLWVQGVFIETDSQGRPLRLEPFQKPCQEVPHESAGNSDED